jgi:hypothetical protein
VGRGAGCMVVFGIQDCGQLLLERNFGWFGFLGPFSEFSTLNFVNFQHLNTTASITSWQFKVS